MVSKTVSPTPGSAPPSSTASPSAATSSRPAPAATASPTPAANANQVGPVQAVTPGPSQVDTATLVGYFFREMPERLRNTSLRLHLWSLGCHRHPSEGRTGRPCAAPALPGGRHAKNSPTSSVAAHRLYAVRARPAGRAAEDQKSSRRSDLLSGRAVRHAPRRNHERPIAHRKHRSQ